MYGDILREENNKNKRLRWANNLEMKKKYRVKKIEENEKVSTQNDKKKDWHKQKTKVSTQSWDEKKLQNMIGKN